MTTTRTLRRTGAAGLAAALYASLIAPVHAAQPHARDASGGSIVLYSAQGYDSAMSKAYAKASGTKVLLTDDSTGSLVAKMEAEKNNPHWDVAWFDGDATMQALNDQHLLYTWTPANVKNYTTLGKSLIPTSHAFYPTGVTAAGVIVYNTRRLSASQAPKDWSDLLTSTYKGKVAENDPAYSGPAFPFIAGQMLREGGLTKGESYFQQLKNNGLKIFQTNDPTLHNVETGALDVGIVQDSAYYGAKLTGNPPIGVVYPKSGVTVLPGEIAINLKSRNLAAAKAFVNYVLSQAGQNVMIHDPNDTDSYFNPIISGVTALPGRQTTGITFQRLNYIWAGQHQATIQSWFHAHVVQ